MDRGDAREAAQPVAEAAAPVMAAPPAATFTIKPPEPFDFAKPQEWEKWIRRFERFRVASNLNNSTDANQVNTLVYCMGDEADNVLRGLDLTDVHRQRYDAVKSAFDRHFVPRKNVIYERAKFNKRVQQLAEPVDSFITALYALAENCEYGALHDELLRDRLVVGLRDSSLSERMQLDKDLTLTKAITMARQSKEIKRQQTDLRCESNVSKTAMDAVHTRKFKPRELDQGEDPWLADIDVKGTKCRGGLQLAFTAQAVISGAIREINFLLVWCLINPPPIHVKSQESIRQCSPCGIQLSPSSGLLPFFQASTNLGPSLPPSLCPPTAPARVLPSLTPSARTWTFPALHNSLSCSTTVLRSQ
ncbi:unnamed protein product [Menidia menidia]|uniref:(Atlantic silverside) hypothetical protein n=1 Tax=Menidia menidia TaxID=238744 RepID=A0A8S4BPX7_9TELE|nr:unnamed protein product [Menidia menidia]